MKKILALILALMMLVVAVAAFAEDGDDGEGNAAVGTPVAASAFEYDETVSVTALEVGDVAHFYKVVEWVGEAEGNVKGWKVVAPFSFDLNAVLVGNPTATPAVAPTGITAELANALAQRALSTETPVASVAGNDTVGEDGIAELDVTAEGLGVGMYMVLITPHDPDVVYNPVFVSSDYTEAGTNAWAIDENATYSNKAAAKKSTTTLTKEASTEEVKPDDVKWITTAIGDTVHFTVTTTIPGFGPAFIDPYFKLTDQLTALKLVADSVTVDTPAAAAAGADIEEAEDGKSYTIEFDPTYLATVSVPTLITISYDAIVDTDAPLNVNYERNEVWTEFSHDINNSEDHSFKKDDTIHYTFTIDAEALANGSESGGKKGSEIVKVGRDSNGDPITSTTEHSAITYTNTWEGPQADAVFKLYRDSGCTEEYIPKVKGTGDTGTALQIVSGEDGRMTIAGLDAGEYWLKEDSCPTGFVMDTHVAHIVISTEESEKSITEWTTDGQNWISQAEYEALGDKTGYKSYTYSVKTLDSYKITINDEDVSSYTFVNNGVEPEIDWTIDPPVELPHQFINTQGLQLPSTGGIGTTIFYVGGGILVLLAVVFLVTKRRMSSND